MKDERTGELANLLSLQDYLVGTPQTQSFGYDALDSGHSHAVTAVSDGWRYEYDPNGNLVRKAYRPGLYFPLVLLTQPGKSLDEPPEPPPAPLSPYPLPEAQSRDKPSGLVAWLHSAWYALVSWFGGGTQTAQAAALQQAYPPPGDPTPTPTFTSTPDPTPTSTPVPTATPDPPEVIEYSYDAENRLVSVSAGDMQASFVYDGDGQRVASVIAGATTVYIGEVFEWEVTTGSMRRYYYAGTQNSPSPQRSGGERVGVRVGSAAPVWLLGDHLGSTSVAANTDGSLLSRQGYLPWGELRFAEGSLPGRYQFTGQASYEAEFGLYYFKARWYDPHLGRFSQPDSIVPDPGNPLDWDRYAYARNNPEKYVDPNGHNPLVIIALIGAAIFLSQIPSDQYQPDPSNWGDPGLQLFGLALMLAPAIVPAACLNDGDCTNEAQAITQRSIEVSRVSPTSQNVWNMNPLARGVAIEDMLGRSPELARNFPVIDRFQNGVATSIKSIDLAARTYQNTNNLTRVIQGYIKSLANWQGANWGDVIIKASDITSRELLLAISPNSSETQMQALLQLQDWALNQGVTLTLMMIK